MTDLISVIMTQSMDQADEPNSCSILKGTPSIAQFSAEGWVSNRPSWLISERVMANGFSIFVAGCHRLEACDNLFFGGEEDEALTRTRTRIQFE